MNATPAWWAEGDGATRSARNDELVEPPEFAEQLDRGYADEPTALMARESDEAIAERDARDAAEGSRLEELRQAYDEQRALEEVLETAVDEDLEPEQLAHLRRIRAVPVLDRLGARVLDEVPTDPPQPLVLGRLDPEGHTVLYGTGGAGKGTLAASWVVQLVAEGHRVVVLDYEGHPGEWARRICGLGGLGPLADVVHVAPMSAAWLGRRGALWMHQDEIRELCDAWAATFVVIDSIVVACGGADPIEPGTVARYDGALTYVGRPTLSLAHVTKDHALAYPFGSVFWHNLARATWSLEPDGLASILTCRKSNNYAKPGRVHVQVTWWEGRPQEVAERSVAAVLGDRLAEVLEAGPMTVGQLVARLDEERTADEQAVKADSIRAALRRGMQAIPKRFTVEGVGPGARWSLVPS